MRKKVLSIAAMLAAGLAAQTTDSRLVILSIDGLMPETLRTADQLELRVPNLIEMRDKGAASQGLIGVFPTVTYPSHTTMVTGRQPAQHGIFGNQLFDPEGRMHGTWFAFTELIQGPTLWDAARAAGKSVGAVSWPVTVGAAIDYNIPEFNPLRSEDTIMLQRAISSPGLFADIEKAHGQVRVGSRQDDAFRAAQAAHILRTRKPQLMLVHLIDLDHEQHEFGPGSKEAHHALEEIDQAIGVLRTAIQDAGGAAVTRWLVVSDHGFWPVSKAFQADAFLASLGLAAPESDRGKWRVGAHSNGGSVAFITKDPGDAEAQKLVRDSLEKLKSDPSQGIDQILDRAELKRRQAYPLAFAAISLQRGFTSGSARSGAVVTDTKTRGMHGYLPGPPELDCTFVAFGPGIGARRLPRAELADVASTAAALLGVRLPGAAGRNLLENQ
jgi:predicted AlkP superfamily pyrophosphatase or phosphodiesterase